MKFFDFSEEVWRRAYEAEDLSSRLSAKTTVHKARFPVAVQRAGFQLLSSGDSFVPGKYDLVIGAAPWSDSDLVALEDLALSSRSRSNITRITVFDVDDIPFEKLAKILPGIAIYGKTPVVFEYRNGELAYFGQGHDAVLWLRQL